MILVILILTIVGIGVAYFTQVEDRISGNDRLAKTAFYAAETGLRAGESLFAAYSKSGAAMNDLLTVSGSFNPPGGGIAARPVTIASVTYVDRVIPKTSDTDPFYLGSQYSLYVRNNLEDPGLVVSGVLYPALDSDKKVNLISVGTVAVPGARSVTRMLEEQLELSSVSDPALSMKGNYASGSGSVQMGGS